MVRINIHVSFVDNYEIGFLEYILDPNLEDGEWHPETKGPAHTAWRQGP